MKTILVAVRRPDEAEAKCGAEIIFERRDSLRSHTILAAKCYESWEQWGAYSEVLSENVRAVEAWRRRRAIPGLSGKVTALEGMK